MVVLYLKLDNIYGFDEFEIDFTYSEKAVDSIIGKEHLLGREQFCYKKAVILMGANATGKTSLGKALMRILAFINTGNPTLLYEMVSEDNASFCIDFVNENYVMHRLSANISKTDADIKIRYESAEIDENDSYEKCLKKLTDRTQEAVQAANRLAKLTGQLAFRFAYPEIEDSLKMGGISSSNLLRTLQAVIGTLDPTLADIALARDLKNTFVIKRKGTEIIIQEGRLLNREMLSSGTAEGIDIAVFLASMLSQKACFYYCDEHFSYIQSDIERRIFGIMMEQIVDNGQLIFTTHNTDMLDLNLPKHAYVFLRKRLERENYKISSVTASEMVKQNTDSLRCAVENDVFASLPDDSLLDELEMG